MEQPEGYAEHNALYEPDPNPFEGSDEEFDERISQDLDGLIYLGALSQTVNLPGGHTVVIRTLKAGEELVCGQIVAEYRDSLVANRAHAAARVAASIETVDGQPLVPGLGPDSTLNVVRQKFEYICKHWHWPIIEQILQEVLDLTVKQDAALRMLEGKS